MRAMGRLAARSLADTVSHVEQVHHAVAARALAVAGPAGHPVRALHDGITTGVYAAVRGAGLVTVLAAGELVGAAARWAPKTAPTPRSNLALAVLNATVGDELADQASPLAIPMAVRRDRVDVAPRRPALEVAFPEASSKVALFVHGLGETEESWRLHADRHGPGTESTYGSRLAQDFGYTPVHVRYNTGLHVSENGRHLTALLDKVVGAWPVPVTEIIVVGHSMGGLVARSACHYAQDRHHSWVSKVRHVFYLGCPHLGAGLEQWVSALSSVLGRLDESRPLASILDRRSAGIKDLRAGHLLDEHWHPDTKATSPGRACRSSPGRSTTRSARPSRRAAATHWVDWWAIFSSTPPVPAAGPVVTGLSRSRPDTCAISGGCTTSIC